MLHSICQIRIEPTLTPLILSGFFKTHIQVLVKLLMKVIYQYIQKWRNVRYFTVPTQHQLSLVDRVTKFLYISENPPTMVFYFLFLFLKFIGGSYHMVLASHPISVLQIRNFLCLCLMEFPYPNSSQHSSQPSSPTFHLKPPLFSSRTTIPFQPLTFSNKPPKYLWHHSLILPRIHPLGFYPLF